MSEGDGTRWLAPGLKISLKVEPGVAVALSDPQSDMTEKGFRQAIKVLFGLNRFFAVGPSMAFTTLPGNGMNDAGTAWAFGGTARLERPRDAPGGRWNAMSPWADVDLHYNRTGSLNKPSFDAALGLAVPLDDDRKYWLGPFVRYSHIISSERVGFDNRDAKILSIGLSFEVGSGLERRRVSDPVVAQEEVTEQVATVPVVPSDRDGDTVVDTEDNCPDVPGPVANAGCPTYAKVVVKPDKLELLEKIAFKWDSAELEPASYPLLDEVAKALNDNRGFKVQVEGHASSEGGFDHNQSLSERRATAVLDYLIAHGVAADRILSKGFGSSTPAATNTTEAGRETNRRVEFNVSFIIVEKAK
ncbi:MAG: OmpA family protein [Deltaproteobacteria bacterium]|nr:OmpA family protein [Deltaproteobacteria bacterium]